jgi:hypothetical protein
MTLQGQTIQDLIQSSQGIGFDGARSSEIAAEVTNLLDAVDGFSELMHFDCEPLQFHAYIANGKVVTE